MDIYAPANFSPCRTYRYSLSRSIPRMRERLGLAGAAPSSPRVMVALNLNPSDANETKPDPTSTRQVGYAEREDCGHLIMVNVWGFVSSTPETLRAQADPIGPNNLEHIAAALAEVKKRGGVVFAGFGAFQLKRHSEYQHFVRALLIDAGAVCLGHNANGSPVHPLYQRADAPLVTWDPKRTASARRYVQGLGAVS